MSSLKSNQNLNGSAYVTDKIILSWIFSLLLFENQYLISLTTVKKMEKNEENQIYNLFKPKQRERKFELIISSNNLYCRECLL